MHTFVYGSRVIENEQQITLERHVRKVGNIVGTVVKSLVALFLFVGLNALLSNLAQHTNLFSVNAYASLLRFIQEATHVLFVDNAFTTSSFVYQQTLSVVSALAVVVCAQQYDLVLSTTGGGTPGRKKLTSVDNARKQHNNSASSTLFLTGTRSAFYLKN